MSLYLGTKTPQEILELADVKNLKRRREKECEAYYSIGQLVLLEGNSSEAVRMFRASVATGVTSFVEYQGAKAELRRMSH